jgi:Domain of unknown function (DUF1707)
MEIVQRGSLRASDADREQVAERLRNACTEGRITPDELDDRLHSALTARTYAELSRVVRDLPSPRSPARRRSSAGVALGGAGSALAFARARPFIAVAVVVPLLIITLAIVTGVFAVWAIWWLVGWWLFGARRRAMYGRYGGPRRSAQGQGSGSSGFCGRHTEARPEYWV